MAHALEPEEFLVERLRGTQAVDLQRAVGHQLGFTTAF